MREKKCARCKETKPWSEFHARLKAETGHVLKVQPYCKPCATAVRREWAARNRDHQRELQRDAYAARKRLRPDALEAKREYQREWKRRRAQDPEWVERQRERQREYKRRRYKDPEYRGRELARKRDAYRRKQGGLMRRGKDDRVVALDNFGQRLPIEPFRAWLTDYFDRERRDTPTERNNDSAVGHVYEQIALAIGGGREAAHRAVYRWLSESNHIPLGHADAVLTRLDSPARLYELWPELEVDGDLRTA